MAKLYEVNEFVFCIFSESFDHEPGTEGTSGNVLRRGTHYIEDFGMRWVEGESEAVDRGAVFENGSHDCLIKLNKGSLVASHG